MYKVWPQLTLIVVSWNKPSTIQQARSLQGKNRKPAIADPLFAKSP